MFLLVSFIVFSSFPRFCVFFFFLNRSRVFQFCCFFQYFCVLLLPLGILSFLYFLFDSSNDYFGIILVLVRPLDIS